MTSKKDTEKSLEKASKILKESKLPKEYKNFILKRLKGSSCLSNILLEDAKTAKDLIPYGIYEDETPENNFDEYFWSDLSGSINDFEASNDPEDLFELLDLGKVQQFDFLDDYDITISEKEGLAVGCQRMERPDFIKFLKEAGKFMGLEVKEKPKKK